MVPTTPSKRLLSIASETQERHQPHTTKATRNQGKPIARGNAKPQDKEPSRHHLPTSTTTRQVQEQQRINNTSQVSYL
jgi:hypothetical protein